MAKPEEAASKAVEGDSISETTMAINGKNSVANVFNPQHRTRFILVVTGVVLVALALFITAVGVLIYTYRSDDPFIQTVANIVPYPVEIVNGQEVTYGQYLFEYNTVKNFYNDSQSNGQGAQAKVNFNDPKSSAVVLIEKKIMTQLTQEALVDKMIAQYKVTVSNQELNASLDQFANQYGGVDKLTAGLSKTYGWTYDQFKSRIEFQLAEQKVELLVFAAHNQQAKARAEEVLAKINAGGDFATLAKQYSQDSTAANGGSLGWITKGGSQGPQFDTAAFALQPGQVSGVVLTSYGYQIIQVTAKKGDQVQASSILIKDIDFDQYLQNQVNQAKITTYYKI